MARKKRERGNGQGTVAPRRNKDGKVVGFVGAFFGSDGKRHWVSAKQDRVLAQTEGGHGRR